MISRPNGDHFTHTIDEIKAALQSVNLFGKHLPFLEGVSLPSTKSRFELWWNFGRLTWSLACEKNMFYMHAITKFQKGPHIDIQNNF